MSESVQFWLDNKMSAGIKMAAIGAQSLVVYREKFYVVEKDAAHTKGGKPLRYSKSSLPAIWKRALRGETVSAESLIIPSDDALPMSTFTKRKRVRKESPQEPSDIIVAHQSPVLAQPNASPVSASVPKAQKTVKKADIKPVTQATVTVGCPHCNHRHELPLEKGKNGKPFFMVCAKCTVDFAVRFVPVMVYQAQVAGFY
jgi:hypothetical protein